MKDLGDRFGALVILGRDYMPRVAGEERVEAAVVFRNLALSAIAGGGLAGPDRSGRSLRPYFLQLTMCGNRRQCGGSADCLVCPGSPGTKCTRRHFANAKLNRWCKKRRTGKK